MALRDLFLLRRAHTGAPESPLKILFMAGEDTCFNSQAAGVPT